jgi:ankyrin repeat protein
LVWGKLDSENLFILKPTKLKAELDNGFSLRIFENFENVDKKNNPLCNAKNGEVAKLLIENDELHALYLYQDDVPVIHAVIDAVTKGIIELSTLEQVAENDNSLERDWDGNRGDYAIHKAVRTGNIEIVKIILGQGINTNILSNDGDTPIGIAAQEGNKEIVELLIKYGSPTKAADFEFLIEFDDEDDIPDVEEPVDLAVTDEIKNILLNA